MKLTSAPTAIFMASLLHATAYGNFDVYYTGISDNLGPPTWGYTVYRSKPSCDEVQDWIWRESDDVSGGKYGVRCSGDCEASEKPSGIDEMEFNFNSDDLHWTTYKDRNWDMVDLDGNKVGHCKPFPADSYHCGLDVGRTEGHRRLRCFTNAATADDINDNRPS